MGSCPPPPPGGFAVNQPKLPLQHPFCATVGDTSWRTPPSTPSSQRENRDGASVAGVIQRQAEVSAATETTMKRKQSLKNSPFINQENCRKRSCCLGTGFSALAASLRGQKTSPHPSQVLQHLATGKMGSSLDKARAGKLGDDRK
ncbi:hypothetical protein AV530_017986 [Patagioenas fasciata monilis]|uniref:Uncharacterized protein n=1 Tax=Patagioenas fasciata monilis TaxID=372326 RepID=A0A1V4KKF1_PATFA|nr:hypothetical protein AV530_017986 [Patagioenas fasciata monilis]